MLSRPRHLNRLVPALAIGVLTGCGGPLSTLAPAGPAAREIAFLWYVMLLGGTAITVLVMGLIAMALRRRPADDTDARAERVWIHGWGLGFSAMVLTALLATGIVIGERMLARDDGAPRVQAIAMQWGWQFAQPGPDGTPVTTDGILYVPAGQDFEIAIEARDVIHSFWVPQLGGKMDAIPGRVNLHRLRADAPGRYEGLCAEFCGIGHSDMRFEVVAYDPTAPLPPFLSADDPQDAAAAQPDPAEPAPETTP